MKPGPDQIVACPSCEGLGKYRTLQSGNTFEERVWTDGKRHYPMLPLPPAVVRCRHCNSVHWLSEAREVGTVAPIAFWGNKPEPVSPEWRDAEYVQEPEDLEYYDAIQAGLARTPEEERDLRIFAWWRSNDAYRAIRSAAVVAEPRSLAAWDQNLQALLLLLDESDEADLLLKAEVYRGLRAWPQAEALLNRVGSANLSTVVTQIRALCESQDSSVREVNLGRPIRVREPVLPDPVGPGPWFLQLEHPMDCPHCQNSSVRYRQVSGGRLICGSCARSFLALQQLFEGRAFTYDTPRRQPNAR
jgi:hypothetical protein